jgi:peptidoglycan/LPS O-acetylase OafA/YrhL
LQACGWLALWDRPERALVYFLYLGNADIAAHGAQPLPLMILWSLAVEEQFYLFWPLLVRRTTPVQLLRVCVFLTLAAPIARGVVANYPAAYVLTICRVDSLAVGAGLAVLLSQAATRAATLHACRRLVPIALVVLLTVLALPLGPSFPQTRPAWFTLLGYLAVAFAFAALVGASIDGGRPWRLLLTAPPLLYIGKRCYGFYVWQCLVGMAIARLTPRSLQTDYRLLTALGWLAATAAVAAISWSLLERPALRLKRFFPHAIRAAGGATAQGAQIETVRSVPLS